MTKDGATTSTSVIVAVSTNQEATPEVPLVPRPPTPASSPLSQTNPTDKMRKREKKSRKEVVEEGEIQEKYLKQTRGSKATQS